MSLDRQSIDARHWAQEFCKVAQEKGFDPAKDADWLMTWFANYWAAVYDPLNSRIAQLEADLTIAKNAAAHRLKSWKVAGDRIAHLEAERQGWLKAAEKERLENMDLQERIAQLEAEKECLRRNTEAAAIKHLAYADGWVSVPEWYVKVLLELTATEDKK